MEFAPPAVLLSPTSPPHSRASLMDEQEHQNLLSKEKECYQIIRNEEGIISDEYKQMRNGVLTI